MVQNDLYWLHYKINNLLYSYITLKWYCRNKQEGNNIVKPGGDLYDFRDGKNIQRLIAYYENQESYDRCEMLKGVIDGLEQFKS